MRYFIHRTIDIAIETLKAVFFIIIFLSIFIPGSVTFWAPNS